MQGFGREAEGLEVGGGETAGEFQMAGVNDGFVDAAMAFGGIDVAFDGELLGQEAGVGIAHALLGGADGAAVNDRFFFDGAERAVGDDENGADDGLGTAPGFGDLVDGGLASAIAFFEQPVNHEERDLQEQHQHEDAAEFQAESEGF